MNETLNLLWTVAPTTRRSSKDRCDILAPIGTGKYTVALYVDREIAEHVVELHNQQVLAQRRLV